MIKIILVSCLVSYLVENFSDQEKFDLCPDSINCLCPKNITAPQIRVRCMDLSMVQEFCGPVSYPFVFLFLLSESLNRCILMRQKTIFFFKFNYRPSARFKKRMHLYQNRLLPLN